MTFRQAIAGWAVILTPLLANAAPTTQASPVIDLTQLSLEDLMNVPLHGGSFPPFKFAPPATSPSSSPTSWESGSPMWRTRDV